MPPAQTHPAGLEQEEKQPHTQLARTIGGGEGGDVYWDAQEAVSLGPAFGKFLDSDGTGGGVGVVVPSAGSPAADDCGVDYNPGAIGISVFTFLKIVGTLR